MKLKKLKNLLSLVLFFKERPLVFNWHHLFTVPANLNPERASFKVCSTSRASRGKQI